MVERLWKIIFERNTASTSSASESLEESECFAFVSAQAPLRNHSDDCDFHEFVRSECLDLLSFGVNDWISLAVIY